MNNIYLENFRNTAQIKKINELVHKLNMFTTAVKCIPNTHVNKHTQK